MYILENITPWPKKCTSMGQNLCTSKPFSIFFGELMQASNMPKAAHQAGCSHKAGSINLYLLLS